MTSFLALSCFFDTFPGKPEDDTVDIWRANLDQSPETVSGLKRLLSFEEKARADRFRFPAYQSRFIVSHGILRKILSCYLRIAPEGIFYFANDHGKPGIGGRYGGGGVRFNLSHSYDRAVYAVATGREVGIDIEYLWRKSDIAKIAGRFFTPVESETIAKLPAAIRKKAFFTCWTRKEAFLKATGCGLALSPRRFEVSVLPEDPPALVHTDWDSTGHLKWSLANIDAKGDYIAALAVEGRFSELRYFDV